MSVAHSTLTGANLHEPKGVAAAAVDKVYVSDGAGSGSWQKLTASMLTGTGNPFGGQLLHVRDSRASGTAGDSLTSGAFRTKTLQTVVTNEITSATLSTNQISLPAGTYYIDGLVNSYTASGNIGVLRLRNITASSDTVTGMASYMNATTSLMSLRGRFTLAGTTTLELQVYTAAGYATTTVASGSPEIYADLCIWKTA